LLDLHPFNALQATATANNQPQIRLMLPRSTTNS